MVKLFLFPLAIPTATGVKALTVPIEVPIEKLKAHPTKNNPGNNNLAGKLIIQN